MRRLPLVPVSLLAGCPVLLLAGCNAGADPAAFSHAAGARASPAVFATQLAGPSTFLAPMPTAVVVLKPGDLNRNRAFCTAITARLPTAQAAMAGSVVAPNLVLTRWLVQLPDVPADRSADCDFLVGTYDYARAARLIDAVRLREGALSGPGPFLLMVVPDATGLHVAGLDGSDFAATDFPRFVDSWAGALHQTEARITSTPDQPGLVRSVLSLVTAILHAAAGVVGGVIQGVVGAL